MTEYILHDGPKVPDRFGISVAEFLNKWAAGAIETAGGRNATQRSKNNELVIVELANYVRRLDRQDRLLRALFRCQPVRDGTYGSVDATGRLQAPGLRQGKVIARAGMIDVTVRPPPDAMFGELVDAAVDDRIAAMSAEHKAVVERETELARAEGIAAGDARAAVAEEREAAAQREASEARALATQHGRRLGIYEMRYGPLENGSAEEPRERPQAAKSARAPNTATGTLAAEIDDVIETGTEPLSRSEIARRVDRDPTDGSVGRALELLVEQELWERDGKKWRPVEAPDKVAV